LAGFTSAATALEALNSRRAMAAPRNRVEVMEVSFVKAGPIARG
jgi:hypothetical protein